MTETYTYDADGERVTRTRNGTTTVYLAGLYEEDLPSGTVRLHYGFNGQVIAQRTKTTTDDTLLVNFRP